MTFGTRHSDNHYRSLNYSLAPYGADLNSGAEIVLAAETDAFLSDMDTTGTRRSTEPVVRQANNSASVHRASGGNCKLNAPLRFPCSFQKQGRFMSLHGSGAEPTVATVMLQAVTCCAVTFKIEPRIAGFLTTENKETARAQSTPARQFII